MQLSGPALILSTLAFAVAVVGCDDGARPPRPTLRTAYGLEPLGHVDVDRTALVLVDFQREFVDGELALPDAEPAIQRARTLLRWARERHVMVVHVRQRAASVDAPLFRPGSSGAQVVADLVPRGRELEIVKTMAGGFTRTDLDAQLRVHGIDTVIIAGFMTHLAVDSTARDAAVLGYHVVVAGDATATRALPGADGQTVAAETVQAVALASLADRFADVMSSRDIVALPTETGPIARR